MKLPSKNKSIIKTQENETQHTPTCIRWTGAHDADGYGRVQVGSKWKGAHRVAWEKLHGEIPTGLVIDHLCRVRNCINVDHMEVVTSKENTLRGLNPPAVNARKKICIHGHKLEGINLRIRSDSHRECVLCRRRTINAYGKRVRAKQAIARASAK